MPRPARRRGFPLPWGDVVHTSPSAVPQPRRTGSRTPSGSGFQKMAPYQRVWVLRWLAAVAAAAAVASLLLPLHAGAQEGTDVSTQLSKVKATLADAKADAKKLTDALDRANAALDQAENELALADQQRRDAHARGVQASAALADANQRVDQLRRILGDRARGVYIAGDPTGLNALVQSGKADQ